MIFVQTMPHFHRLPKMCRRRHRDEGEDTDSLLEDGPKSEAAEGPRTL